VATSIARIHWQNLANFGVLALEFTEAAELDAVEQGDHIRISDLRRQLRASNQVTAHIGDREVTLQHRLSERQVEMVLAGG
ncbi:aconitate hydratase, partial [Bacillus thuringiensis]|nr:aconitate hydratase [Bacillus thuringiensis]